MMKTILLELTQMSQQLLSVRNFACKCKDQPMMYEFYMIWEIEFFGLQEDEILKKYNSDIYFRSFAECNFFSFIGIQCFLVKTCDTVDVAEGISVHVIRNIVLHCIGLVLKLLRIKLSIYLKIQHFKTPNFFL